MKTFILVHGMFHGGWCWRHVAERLRARGHRVTTPTLSGVGERAHLLSESIDLATHITDIERHLWFEDFEDVVLVGHSFAGAVITGVADRAANRIGRLIYLDAFIMLNGESAMSLVPPEIAAERVKQSEETSGGLTIPTAPASAFGISDPEQAAWVDSRLTPHPMRTYTSELHLNAAPANGLPADYIACVKPVYPVAQGSHERAKELGWPMHELASAHDAMVIAPGATADLLETIVA